MCSAFTSGEGLAGGDLVEHHVGVDAGVGQHRAQEGLVLQRLALVVAEREERPVDGEELLGEPVADDHADLQRQQAACRCSGSSHTSGSPSARRGPG